jgi:hypothetical protein
MGSRGQFFSSLPPRSVRVYNTAPNCDLLVYCNMISIILFAAATRADDFPVLWRCISNCIDYLASKGTRNWPKCEIKRVTEEAVVSACFFKMPLRYVPVTTVVLRKATNSRVLSSHLPGVGGTVSHTTCHCFKPIGGTLHDIVTAQTFLTGCLTPCSIPGGDWEFFSSPPRPERPWGPPSLLSNGY